MGTGQWLVMLVSSIKGKLKPGKLGLGKFLSVVYDSGVSEMMIVLSMGDQWQVLPSKQTPSNRRDIFSSVVKNRNLRLLEVIWFAAKIVSVVKFQWELYYSE